MGRREGRDGARASKRTVRQFRLFYIGNVQSCRTFWYGINCIYEVDPAHIAGQLVNTVSERAVKYMHWRSTWQTTGRRLYSTVNQSFFQPSRYYPLSVADDQIQQTRHLLRAILRETTYLPDEQARKYTRRHIISRFRDYSVGSRPSGTIYERREEKLEEANEALKTLIRANAGEIKSLQRVLLLSYGRVGKRRHELMRPLLETPDVPSDHTGMTRDGRRDSLSANSKRAAPAEGLPTLNGKLMALLQSQATVQPQELTRKNPKHVRQLRPRIPEHNSWGRPMPEVRVKNMTKRWYAEQLNRVLPPLPTSEWERLQDLATGEAKPERLAKRRIRTKKEIGVYHSDLQREKIVARLLKQNIYSRDISGKGHDITSRSMRRIWAVIFSQCPLMSWDSVDRRWKVEWGSNVLKRKVMEGLFVGAETPRSRQE